MRHAPSLLLLAFALAACGGPAPEKFGSPGALSKCDPYAGPAPATLAVYEGSLHMHSGYSDGDPHMKPQDYFHAGRELGYAYVAGGEHSDTMDDGFFASVHDSCVPGSNGYGADSAQACSTPAADRLTKWNAAASQAAAETTAEFLAIRGFEWTSDVYGHINVYFSKNFSNAKNDGGYAATMDTFWDWFTRDPAMPGAAGSASSPTPYGGGNDGLATFNHPHDKCSLKSDPTGTATGFCDWNDYALIPAAAGRMFGMELYNGDNRKDKYQPYFMHALDKGWRLSPVGAEDDHYAHYGDEIRPKTGTLARGTSEADIREAWRARRTWAESPGQHLKPEVIVDHQAPMGAQLACAAAAGSVTLDVKLTQWSGTPFEGTYRLFSNGGAEIAAITGKTANFELPVESGKVRWYFVRADGLDGVSAAYLAPVWITGK